VISAVAQGGHAEAWRFRRRGEAITGSALDGINDYVALNQQQMEASIADATAQYESAAWTLGSVLLVSLVVAVVSTLWISLNISRGLGRAVGLANAIALGDLSQKLVARATTRSGTSSTP